MRPIRPIPSTWIALALLVGSAWGCGHDAVAPEDTSANDEPQVIPSVATAWLRAHVHTFDTSVPSEDLSDLEFLRDIVGNARVVSLGEATHGTREFHEMKDHILRYLVERMGFTGFALEATWPEGNRLDAYVRTGVGEPASLLSGMYFWTIRSQAVMNMIGWMRRTNAAGTPVGFYGFDMQYPGMALENVVRFFGEAGPELLPGVEGRLACLRPYVNDSHGAFPQPGYETVSEADRNACYRDLSWVHDTLGVLRDELTPRAGADAFERALRSARLLVQFEELYSGRRDRDAAMAENALWLLDQLGPDGKLVLWAHNAHVSTSRNRMGQRLREVLGDDLVTVGFTFARGSFMAVSQTGQSYYAFEEHFADAPPPDSYEAYFHSTYLPRFVLDLRGREPTSDSTSWLHAPLRYRFIGAAYNRNYPQAFFIQSDMCRDFDVVVYFAETTATRILPSIRPDSFYP